MIIQCVHSQEAIIQESPRLVKGSNISFQGNSVSILGDFRNKEVDPCRCIVKNLVNEKTVKFNDGNWIKPAVFFNNGLEFITCTFKDPEGKRIYKKYDLDGNKIGEVSLKGDLNPSETGRYFYTRFNLLSMSMPTLYDEFFNKIHTFEIEGNDWDACIIQDSLYILKNNKKIRLYALPDLYIIKEIEFNLDYTNSPPINEFYVSQTGDYCAVSNYKNVIVVNLKTAETTPYKYDFVQRVEFSDDDKYVYFINSKNKSINMDIYGLKDNSYKSLQLDLSLKNDNIQRIYVHTFLISGTQIIVNFSYITIISNDKSIATGSAYIPNIYEKLNKSDMYELLEGPSWFSKIDNKSVRYNFESNTNSIKLIGNEGLEGVLKNEN